MPGKALKCNPSWKNHFGIEMEGFEGIHTHGFQECFPCCHPWECIPEPSSSVKAVTALSFSSGGFVVTSRGEETFQPWLCENHRL